MEGMYQAHVIAPNVYHIEEKLANPGFMTLVVGMQRALLFDTGYGSGDLRSFVASLTDKSIEVVLSHGHGDHVGNAWQFGEVWIHPKDDAICRAAHSVESRAARWGRNTRYKDQAPDIPRGRGYYDYVNPGLQDLHLKYLEDGQTFDLGGKTAEVFWMPGHTEGEIGMFLREDRIFLTGDCANPTFFLFTCDQTNAEDHIRNLKRLLQLPFAIKYIDPVSVLIASILRTQDRLIGKPPHQVDPVCRRICLFHSKQELLQFLFREQRRPVSNHEMIEWQLQQTLQIPNMVFSIRLITRK